jgi:hypothetical protein
MKTIKTVVVAVVVAAAAALLYGELILDWRTPHVERNMKMALTSSSSFLIADYNRLQEEMKGKYGDGVSVSVPISTSASAKNGIAEVSVKGNVVESHSLKRLYDISGLFIFNPDDPAPVRFPFRLEPHQNFASLDRSLAVPLAEHFTRVPAAWFKFSDTDWTIDRCSNAESGLGLGMLGDLLRLQEGTSCVVTWKSNPSSSMLIFVGRADGKKWLRPFTQWACRHVLETQSEKMTSAPSRLNFGACMLGDRSTGDGLGTIFGAVYGFAPDGRLGLVTKVGNY